MPLSAGDKLGPYDVIAPIGAGGMGEVYKALDTRLHRMVAIKVLPEHIALREDLRARFEREARTVASLNHPSICTLYDIGKQDGVGGFMVMELIEGESLAARIQKGAIPIAQALSHAAQIADAPDRAHRAGVTHRDVKPQNIMLTRDGVKVLDFGLAKSRPKLGVNEETLLATLTSEGAVLGTPQYMSPEQFEGKEADVRSDIWAFGAVLYEMLSGQKAFPGKSYSSIASAILSAEPPTMATSPAAPIWLDRMVKRCLAKDPEARYQSIRDLLLDLQMPLVESPSMVLPVRSRWQNWALLAALAAVAVLSLRLWLSEDSEARTADKAVRRFSFNLPAGAIHPVISPDGRRFVFVQGSPPRLWVQDLDQRTPRELEGTSGASKPFWSPDSRLIAFFSGNQVRKVPAQGGPVSTITDDAACPYERQGAWSPDGSQVAFTAQSPTKVYLAPASGGAATLAVDVKPGDGYFLDPLFLPGEAGKGKLIAVEVGGLSKPTIILQDIRTGQRQRLVTGARPSYAASGHLIFMRDGIWALPISPTTGSPIGEPFAMVSAGIDPTVANDGSLMYQDPVGGMRQLYWFDRAGRRQAPIGKPMRLIDSPSLSRNGRFVATGGGDSGAADIWILDTVRETNSRLTTASGVEAAPSWTSKDQEIIYWKTEEPTKGVDIFSQKVDGSETARPLVVRPGFQYFMSSSADGRFLFYTVGDAPGKPAYIAYLDRNDKVERPAFSLSVAGQGVQGVQPSPDGRMLAYSGNQSGSYEIYVERLGGGGRLQISTQGGTQPRWNAAGTELFYVRHDTVMAVAVKFQPDFSVGQPVKLFSHPGLISKFAGPQYDVSADGQRFVVVDAAGGLEKQGQPVWLVENWLSEFARRKE